MSILFNQIHMLILLVHLLVNYFKVTSLFQVTYLFNQICLLISLILSSYLIKLILLILFRSNLYANFNCTIVCELFQSYFTHIKIVSILFYINI